MVGALLMNKRLIVVCGALIGLATSTEAKVLRLTCTDAATRTKYEFSYDTARNTLATTHREFTDPVEVEKVQEEPDGLLVWGMMRLRPATKNVLLRFGKEKWAVHFFGYNEQRKDSCV